MSTIKIVGPAFDYNYARVRDFKVNATREIQEKKGKRPTVLVDGITLPDGRVVQPTKRFWTSIQVRFGFSSNIFRYFTHEEVFSRISERAPNDQVKFCVETHPNGANLLAVTNPTSSTVRFNQLEELLNRYGAEGATYAGGIVRSTHKPRIGAQPFPVSGDDFVNQFVIDTPIDGFGKPNIYLSMMRLLCANGAIGYGRAFRSEVALGKEDEDVAFALVRAMDGFNNEEGFAAMRSRFENAARSWASVAEVQKLYKVLANCAGAGVLIARGREIVHGEMLETTLPLFDAFHKMTGDVTQIYGLANIDALSVKRQRTLPTACKVYDLLNFATEIATHHAQVNGNRRLQAYVGDLLSNEFDLEGTVDEFSDWKDFFVGSDDTVATLGVIRNS